MEGPVIVKPWLKPGYLTKEVKADSRRGEFDIKNQVIIQNNVSVDILFIGDSITQMWELAAYFHKPGLRMINRGIGGDRTEYLLHRFFADAVQLKPSVCVLMVGINDSWELEFDVWKQEGGRPVESVLKQALQAMEQVLDIAVAERMRLAVCSILPTRMEWTNHEQERQLYIRSYNAGLKELAEKRGFIFVDYYPAFINKEDNTAKRELTVEGLHPNVFGYNLMAGILAEALNKYGIVLK